MQPVDARLLTGLVKSRQRFRDDSFDFSRQSAGAARRASRPHEQGARDRSRSIRLQQLIEPSPLYPELAAGAKNLGPARLIARRESADHRFSDHSLFPGGGVDR
jgi:hypothetical protein